MCLPFLKLSRLYPALHLLIVLTRLLEGLNEGLLLLVFQVPTRLPRLFQLLGDLVVF